MQNSDNKKLTNSMVSYNYFYHINFFRVLIWDYKISPTLIIRSKNMFNVVHIYIIS